MTPREARRAVRELAVEVGAYLYVNQVRGGFDVEVEAPSGWVWKCDGLHVLISTHRRGDEREDCWLEVLNRMRAGLSECDPDCDTCSVEEA